MTACPISKEMGLFNVEHGAGSIQGQRWLISEFAPIDKAIGHPCRAIPIGASIPCHALRINPFASLHSVVDYLIARAQMLLCMPPIGDAVQMSYAHTLSPC